MGFSFNPASNALHNTGKSTQVEKFGVNYYADTVLRLEFSCASLSHASTSKQTKRKWSAINGPMGPEDGCSLSLGMVHPGNSNSMVVSSATACITISSAEETGGGGCGSIKTDLQLGNEKYLRPNEPSTAISGPKFDLELSLSTLPAESGVTSVSLGTNLLQKNVEIPGSIFPIVDEGTTSSRWKQGNAVARWHAMHKTQSSFAAHQVPGNDNLETLVIGSNVPIMDEGSTSSRWKQGNAVARWHAMHKTTSSFAANQFRGKANLKTPVVGEGSTSSRRKLGNAVARWDAMHKTQSSFAAYQVPGKANLKTPVIGSDVPIVDEGSTSFSWKEGNAVARWHAMHKTPSSFVANQVPRKANLVSVVSNISSTVADISKNSQNSASEIAKPPQRSTNIKTCQFAGCGKGARGSSGLCIAHGGGRRCQEAGCTKGAEGRTANCKAHGGGRRCETSGCAKSAEGRTNHCIAHGGGRRCSHEGCPRAARGKSGLCIKHGGGKRCKMENCPRSAEGLAGLCISHGGGKRCKFPECTKGAQGSTMLCKAHGGGKRCTAFGCTKGAEGSTSFCKSHGGGKRCSFQGEGVCPKSVHGGTLFCVAHGGGKRCAELGCEKSARGRTNYCVRHGGGRRCQFKGCPKSAQGSTNHCKAHGGGKRCTWSQSGFEIGDQAAVPCDRIAQGKIGLCASHTALLQDEQVHGGGTMGPPSQHVKATKPEKMKSIVIIEDVPVDFMKLGCIGRKDVKANKPEKMKGVIIVEDEPVDFMKRQCRKSFSFNGNGQSELSLSLLPKAWSEILPQSRDSFFGKPGIEGRVHGGNLMAILASSSGQAPPKQ